MNTENVPLSVQKSAPFFWRPWIIGVSLAVLAVVGLLSFDGYVDTQAWRFTRWVMGTQERYDWQAYKMDGETNPEAPWYQRWEAPLGGKLYEKTEKMWRILKDMGEPQITVFLLAVVWLYDRRRFKAAVLLGTSTAAAGVVAALLRFPLGRLRPTGTITQRILNAETHVAETMLGVRNDGENYWAWLRGIFEGSDLSFPSGHATLAFATAAVLIYLSPRGKWLFLTIASLCALSRVVMHAHFFADVVAGGTVGFVVGSVVVRLGDRYLEPRKMEGAQRE